MIYLNLQTIQCAGTKNHTRDTGWNTRIQTAKKIVGTKNHTHNTLRINKRKPNPTHPQKNAGIKNHTRDTQKAMINNIQGCTKSRVLKIIPVIRGGVRKRKKQPPPKKHRY